MAADGKGLVSRGDHVALTYITLLHVVVWRCDTCPAVVHFFIPRRDGRISCAECWRKAGAPFPREMASDEEIYQREQATRERMKARGGTARHLVNAGKA